MTQTVQAFRLPNETDDDVLHSIATRGEAEFVLRVALTEAQNRVVRTISQWKTRQIDMNQWAHMGPTDKASDNFRRNIAQTFILLPWLFYAIVIRANARKPLTLDDLANASVDDTSVPAGRRPLFDSWITTTMAVCQPPPPVGAFLATTRQQNFFGIPFAAGTMLNQALQLANDIVLQAELIIREAPTPDWQSQEYLPV